MTDKEKLALQLTLKYLEICNPFDSERQHLSSKDFEKDAEVVVGIYNLIYSKLNDKFDLSSLL